MKTRYKYINFEELTVGQWHCFNNKSNDVLCEIGYDKPWKQWVVEDFIEGCVFSYDCLIDIADFLKQLNAGPSQGAPDGD